MKILIVEDETKIREGLRKIVEDVITSGLSVAEASSGKEAIEWLKTQDHVDLMLTDIRMSEMDGIALIKKVHQTHSGMHVVVISGYDEFVYAREAMRYGTLDYLLKPIDRVELARVLGRVQEMIGGSKHEVAAKDAGQQEDDKERLTIRKVKEFVGQSLDKDISLPMLAQHVYLHPKYLSDMFKRETGQNLSDYVTERRLEKAKKLLKETTMRIADIAQLCGFANHKYFASLFKQHNGCTPTEFRDL
ncbi:response regulator transcription factor [Paenibacillus sedimenti]|uniref:Response regulator n=1 Tax=Paenibacillus sedimenti TaxID=2770274 RepID=A0A926QHZ0_9BACL|nr:response regulator [Paenibacillus sedimenti]MBD0378777.1 response regulator [Paenibacillus sedimenti]